MNGCHVVATFVLESRISLIISNSQQNQYLRLTISIIVHKVWRIMVSYKCFELVFPSPYPGTWRQGKTNIGSLFVFLLIFLSRARNPLYQQLPNCPKQSSENIGSLEPKISISSGFAQGQSQVPCQKFLPFLYNNS